MHGRPLLLVVASLAFLSCVHPHTTPVSTVDMGDHVVITQAMLEKSGTVTAWDALKKLAPQFTYGERRNGEPTSLERRGRSSFVLNDAPLLFLDGVRVPDFRVLERIPTSDIARIDILNGIDGTTYYGSNAVNGVILIRTKNGDN